MPALLPKGMQICLSLLLRSLKNEANASSLYPQTYIPPRLEGVQPEINTSICTCVSTCTCILKSVCLTLIAIFFIAFRRDDFPVLGRPTSIIQMPIVLKRGRIDFTAKSVIVETLFNWGAHVSKHYRNRRTPQRLPHDEAYRNQNSLVHAPPHTVETAYGSPSLCFCFALSLSLSLSFSMGVSLSVPVDRLQETTHLQGGPRMYGLSIEEHTCVQAYCTLSVRVRERKTACHRDDLVGWHKETVSLSHAASRNLVNCHSGHRKTVP